MSVSFDNAPLVELVAELRWSQPAVSGSPTVPQTSGQIPLFVLGHNAVEDFLMRLAGEVYQRGYRLAERIVPPGFPITTPFQPICRYRSAEQDKVSTLYQAGLGTFTANAIPPYESWDSFAPIVADGVDALLAARTTDIQSSPFLSVSLRYIDAFRQGLTEGRDVTSFMAQVLGISVNLPPCLTRQVANGQQHKPSLSLSIPLANGMKMTMAIGEGLMNNEIVVLMDTTVSSVDPVGADRDAVMQVLNAAHSVIHEVFIGMTAPIQGLMKPNERGGDHAT